MWYYYAVGAITFVLLILFAAGWLLFRLGFCRKGLSLLKFMHKKSIIPDEYADELRSAGEWMYAQNYEEIDITNDGLRLHGYLLAAKGASRTFICFHGYRSNAMENIGEVIELLSGLGNVLMVDQRAHGKSEGKYITLGIRESDDCKAWADYAAERFGGSIYLYGISMGAATVLMSCGLKLHKSVSGVIADCGFTSPYDIVSHVAKVGFSICGKLLLPFICFFCRLAGFSLKGRSTVAAMQACSIPVLFVHGDSDDFVPCSMSKAGFDACTSPKQLLLVKGAGHGMSYLADTVEYEKLINWVIGNPR